MTTQAETQFTPGPWEASKIAEILCGEASERAYVCGGADKTSVLARVTHADDADLIAAAPELYEALELLLAPSDGHDNMNREFARRALAKARGEA